jgi:hypothetical protein
MWQRQVTSLRPLGVGERLDVAIKIVRRNFLAFAKAALVIAIPSAIVVGLIVLSMVSSLRSVFSATSKANGDIVTPGTGDLTTFFGGLLALELFSFLVITLITAVAFSIVSNAYLGQPTGWRAAIGVGFKRLHSLIWVQLLTGLVVVISEIAFALASAALSAAHVGAVNVVLVLGFFTGVAWFAVATALAMPTVMLENIRGTKAIRRSISLTRKYWWTTFGTLMLSGLLSYVALIVLGIVMFFLANLVGRSVPGLIVFGLVGLLCYLLLLSFIAAILVVVTIDLRVRKEGFDIQHLASQLGTTPTSSALSFMPPARGGPVWGYGVPGGPAGSGYGGAPAPPGWPQAGGWPGGQQPQQPWGQPQPPPWGQQPPQQPWGQPPAQQQTWGPPPPAQQQPWGPPPPQPWGQPPAQQPWGPTQQQPWGQQQPPQQPWGPPQQEPPPGAPPGWPQPSPTPPPPRQTPPAQRTPPGLSPDAPRLSTEGAPLRPLPPFFPRDARPEDAPPAGGSPEPPSPQQPPPDPEPDS